MKSEIILLFCGILIFSCQPILATDANSLDSDNLLNMSIEELMDIEVTTVSKKEDSLFKSPASVTVITSEDIRRSGLQSIPELLRLVPGVHVARIDTNKWAITARGFNGLYADKLLVLIDGRTVYTPLYSGVYWDVQDVMLEDVDRIEVIKGPGATLWGANAVNGVINIITKNSKNTQGNLFTAAAGTEEKFFSSIRNGGKLGDNAYYRVYAKYFDRDNGQLPGGDVAYDAYDQQRQGFRIDWDYSDRDHITFQGDFYNGTSSTDRIVIVPSPGSNQRATENQIVRGWNMLARWDRKYSDDSDMKLQFYFDRTERYTIPLDETRDTFDIDFQRRFQLADNHNLIWGLGFRNTSDNIGNTYVASLAPSTRTDVLLTGFVQDEITIVEDKLKFIVGTKLEKNDYTGTEFQPSARLLWTPDDRNTIWTSFTRAVATPSRVRTDMTLTYNSTPAMRILGNNNLKSQVLKSYELGYRVKPKDNLLLDFSAFYNEYDEAISQENFPNAFNKIYDNKLYGETYGTEIAAHWLVTDYWKLVGSYSFLRMQMHNRKSSTDTTSDSKEERYSPKNMFYIGSQFDLTDDIELDTNLYYVDNIPQFNIPSYLRMDVGLTWHVNNDLDVSVVGQNLLDKSHPEFSDSGSYYSEVQRGIFGKLTYRF